MILPLWCELNQLTCISPSEVGHIFKQGLHLHDDHLVFPHHVPFMLIPSKQIYMLHTNLKMSLILQSLDFTEPSQLILWILQFTGQWLENIPFGMPLLASLQFWTEDLDPVTLGIAPDCIYTTFFYTSMSHTLCQQSEETLFGCFVIALNAAFTQQLSLADEGYKSGSDNWCTNPFMENSSHTPHF